jgi:HD-GYP domain-containing protein (c-di-GMP phosphodiesterase class II)
VALEGRDLSTRLADNRRLLALPLRRGKEIAGLLTAIMPAAAGPSAAAERMPAGSAARGGIATEPKAAPPRDLTTEMLRTLARALGQHLELAMQSMQQAAELSSLYSELGLLHRVAERLTQPGNAWQTAEFILRQGCTAANAEIALLQLPGARTPISSRNPLLAEPAVQISNKELRQLAGQLWWRVGNCPANQFQGPLCEILGCHAPPFEPLQIAVSRLDPVSPKAGFLAFLRIGSHPFAPHELRLLGALAEQSWLAIKSAGLHEDVTGFLMSTVKALVSAIEAKDAYTSGHSARVNLLSMLLGKQLRLSLAEMESLKWASILHDVGKIGMPESILNKTGRLSVDEFEVVKQHPRRGHQVLSHISQLKIASQAVLFHHERIDGRGYPMGISGNAIPKPARIIAVADTFDALTSTRPYREAWSVDEAHSEIQNVRGQQLDAEVVDALADMIPFLKEHRVMFESCGRAA